MSQTDACLSSDPKPDWLTIVMMYNRSVDGFHLVLSHERVNLIIQAGLIILLKCLNNVDFRHLVNRDNVDDERWTKFP